jgi:hypothetical protein
MASSISLILVPVELLAGGVLQLLRFMGFINLVGFTSSNMFRNLGQVVGILTGAFVTYRIIVALSAAAQAAWAIITGLSNIILNAYIAVLFIWANVTRLATVAQWALNVAMDANPVGLVIVGIALLAIALYELYTHATQITNWFNSLPKWAQVIMMALAPFVIIPARIIANWDRVRATFLNIATVVRQVIGGAILWLTEKIEWLFSKLNGVPKWITSHYAGWDNVPVTAGVPGYKPGEFTTPVIPQRQQELLVNSSRAAQDSTTLRGIHQELQIMNQRGATPVPPTPIQLHLDGKVLAKSVNKHNGNEHASGRGGY